MNFKLQLYEATEASEHSCHHVLKHDMKSKNKNMFKIQHSKKHVRILKIMETLVGMTFSMTSSIVIMQGW